MNRTSTGAVRHPTSVDDFVRLVQEVDHDWGGAALDVGHQGRFEELVKKVKPKDRGTAEGIKAYNDLKLELVDRLGAKLIHLHVHDIEPNTWREHKPLIYGFIDYARLIQRLREYHVRWRTGFRNRGTGSRDAALSERC